MTRTNGETMEKGPIPLQFTDEFDNSSCASDQDIGSMILSINS